MWSNPPPPPGVAFRPPGSQARLPAKTPMKIILPIVLLFIVLVVLSAHVNLPGTDKERPNWRRRLDPDVSVLCRTLLAQTILAALQARTVR